MPPAPAQAVLAARSRLAGVLGSLSQPARERIAVTGFLLGSEGPLDRLLARSYFEVASRSWAVYETDASYHTSFLEGLAALDVEPKRAVDLGTGAGGTAYLLAQRWPACEVVGIDSSRFMVRSARRQRSAPNLQFRVDDGLRLQLPDGSVDLVTSLNYMPFPGEMRRVLAPDGHVLVASTFQGLGSRAVEAHWETFGFALHQRAGADRGSFEIYRRTA